MKLGEHPLSLWRFKHSPFQLSLYESLIQVFAATADICILDLCQLPDTQVLLRATTTPSDSAALPTVLENVGSREANVNAWGSKL